MCEQVAAMAAGKNAFITLARNNRIKRPKNTAASDLQFYFLIFTYIFSDLFSCVQRVFLYAFEVFEVP